MLLSETHDHLVDIPAGGPTGLLFTNPSDGYSKFGSTDTGGYISPVLVGVLMSGVACTGA